jgi:galactokinase
MPSNLIRDRTGAAPYVTPFLDALDRMQERRFVGPDRLTERAEALLVSQFGASHHRADAAFAHGSTGLLGGHTHYFDGFALLISLPLGTAVAIRSSEAAESRLIFEGSSETWTFDGSDAAEERAPAWVRLVTDTVRRMAPAGSRIEVAVVSTIPYSCMDAYVAALGVATARASQAVFALPLSARQIDAMVREVVETCLDLPFGIAYLMTADEGRPDHFSLVDAGSLERLALEAPSHETLGWGLVDTGIGPIDAPAFHRKKKDLADEAVTILRRKGFPALASLRDLEHRDLKLALDALSSRYRPVVRHLVTENRRVQKLVGAVRRRDWQMFGALLLMSHASLQKDWGGTNEVVDLIVRETEALSLEGMYGACLTSRGGAAVVVGQPFAVPRCLDQVQASLKASFDVDANVMLL